MSIGTHGSDVLKALNFILIAEAYSCAESWFTRHNQAPAMDVSVPRPQPHSECMS